MSRVTAAVYGQLAAVLLVAVAAGLVYIPAGLATLGVGIGWWWRYVYDLGEQVSE